MKESCYLSRPDDLAFDSLSSGWLMTKCPMASGWHNEIWNLSHPDDLGIPSISPGWLMVDALCHPDDLPGVGISSGWVTAISLCLPDDIFFHLMSSGWLNWGWYLTWMNYGNVIMSSGWDTLLFISHPDEIATFNFVQHAMALLHFRTFSPTNRKRYKILQLAWGSTVRRNWWREAKISYLYGYIHKRLVLF